MRGVLTGLGRWISVFILFFCLIAFLHASSVMYMIALLCVGILVAAYIFARRALQGLSCHRDLPITTVHSGDPLSGTLHLREAHGRWRMLELLDQHENLVTGRLTRRRMMLMTEGAGGRTVLVSGNRQGATLLPDGGRVIEVPDVLRFARRGHYRLGPITVRSHDVFGLLALSHTVEGQQEVIVYPRPLPIPDIAVGGSGGRQESDVRPMGRAGESSDFHGIRPYVEGDDLRRVHWKATAHTGGLAVKEYEYRFSGAVQVILDLQHGVHMGEGEFSTLEAGITLAASVLNHVIGAGNQAGLLATGEKVVHLPQESGQRQLHRALEALALARDDGEVSLAQALASDEARTSRRCTAIVITATVDMELVGTLLSLRGRSAQVLLVLLNPRSFIDAEQEEHRPKQGLLSMTISAIDLKKSLQEMVSGKRGLPTEEDHRRLLHVVAAAGIDVIPIGAQVPLHVALQSIRTRMM